MERIDFRAELERLEQLPEEERREEIARSRNAIAAQVRQEIAAPRLPMPRIPKHFANKRLSAYKPRNRAQAVALQTVQQWVTEAAAGKPALLALIGATETGKSHLLYAAARELHVLRQRVYCRPWYLLGDELRYGRREEIQDEEGKRWDIKEPWEVRHELWRQRILMLDEVRKTSGTEFDDMELTKLACFAYDEDLAMLITTNVNPLADVMGAPAARRFAQVNLGETVKRPAAAAVGEE